MSFNLTLPQKGLVLVSVPVLFQLAFLLVLTVLLKQAEYEAMREAHAKEVTVHSDLIVSAVDNYANMVLGYWETGDPALIQAGDKQIALLTQDLPQLKRLVIGNPRQERTFQNLDSVYHTLQRINDEVKKTPPRDSAAWQGLISQAWRFVPLARTELQKLNADESIVASSAHTAKADWRDRLKSMTMVATGADVLLAAALAAFFTLQIVKRLQVLTENSVRLGKDVALLPPLRGEDEIGKLDHVFHDMADALAELRRKERAMIENAVDVICSIDASGNFSNVNVAALKVWGYSREELVSRSYTMLVAKEDLRHTELAIKNIIESKSSGSFENRIVRKDESLLPSLWSASWSPTEQALFCVVHDITERKELEQLKQDFVAMVSHDLRTPLASLQGGLLLLQGGRHGTLSERGQKFVDTGVRSVDRLIKLINDLLDVEKLEAGKFDMNMRPIQLQDVIDRSVTDVKQLADSVPVTMQWCAVDLEVRADEERLVQVLVNYLGNAVKFSIPRGKIEISVEQPSGWVEVRVKDEGPGIPPEYKEAVFDRFKQLPGGQQKKGSSGLGLAICKVIVEQHGGVVGVDSEVGKGSTFWFRIPSGEQEPE
jgi:PAS domain S-box-containing protein